jgi:soluble lytic murein transglycosylase-like protein
MPQTAKRFGVRDAYAVEDNLRGGTAYIRWLLDLFDGDLRLALAAYNAGENAVMRAGWRVPDITETRAYVPKVLAYLAHFESQSKVHPR